MDRNRRQQNQNEESGWETFANIAVGVTAAAVGIGAIIGAMNELSTETQEQPHSSYAVQEPSSDDEDEAPRALTYQGTAAHGRGGATEWTVARREPTPGPACFTVPGPKIRNVHSLLNDIHIRHIALKDEESEEHCYVFQSIFWRLHAIMKDVDPYYKRYSSTVQFAGSHYDGLRINKPDEIDLDIVIRLPINIHEDPAPGRSDAILEHKTPGYVQLRMGQQFQNLPYREDWHINQTAYRWMDEKKYLLRSEFLYWFRSVVHRALNCFGKNQEGIYFTPVDSVFYTIRTSGSGPAVTLVIENEVGFKLSVDLVPALKFPEERWPICRGYRGIPEECEKKYFMVVPKESKELVNQIDKDRAWRLALHLQERELMHDTNHLRQTIRFIGAIIGAMNELSTETQEQPHSSYAVQEPSSDDEDEAPRALTYQGTAAHGRGGATEWTVARREPTPGPACFTVPGPKIRNVHSLLNDIHIRHIALKDEESEEHCYVFQSIFWRLHAIMKDVDPYYKRYSSTVQFAGSHYDGLRINKPDEIDLDIVIRLPINIHEDPAPGRSDAILEHKTPGYVQLRMGQQFQNLPYREDWHINQTAYRWMDEKKYLLRSEFLYWFRSVVHRALNCFGKNQEGIYFTPVDSVFYTIRTSGSGPAVTLVIENEVGFKLSVDLVPALKFPEERWPICRGYRGIPEECEKKYFMVVPKESKELVNQIDKDRAWRLALHLQERELMHDTNHLRQTIRFIKKLRDSQGMVQIRSYFIKTLFYLEVIELPDSKYWQNNSATLLIMMAKRLEQALRSGTIPYFWNKDLNLLWDVNRSTLTGYANKLKEFISVLETPSAYKEVARYLLTREEYELYRRKFEQ